MYHKLKQTTFAMDQQNQLHFVLFPLMAPGHMIPMIDIAKLISLRGIIVSIITTPQNVNRFSPTILRAVSAGCQIRLLQIRFPSVEAGLPQGCENLDTLPSLDMAMNFFVALNMLQEEVGQLFQELSPPPSCVISDMGLPWTTQIALKFNIPRIIFHGTCCFSLLCSYNIVASKILDTLESDTDEFEVPNLPHRIRLLKSQVVSSVNTKAASSSVLKEVTEKIRAAEKASFGVLVNSFQELEPEYVKEYSKVKGEKVWCVGPVSMCNKDSLDLADRGNKASIDIQDCIKWLDGHEPGSVIYVSLGSLSRLAVSQMTELALGLEMSNKPFIWALCGGGDKNQGSSLDTWILQNGFEERNKGRGLIIRGWAPQLVILSHSGIGAFLTHCGWNSIIEGISAGVPMVTWPLFAEQFCNEKFVVHVLGIGVRIGAQVPIKWGEEEKIGVIVKMEDIEKAIKTVMDEGEEGIERRRKAREIAKLANMATDENGSSHANMTMLIEEIMAKKEQDTNSSAKTSE